MSYRPSDSEWSVSLLQSLSHGGGLWQSVIPYTARRGRRALQWVRRIIDSAFNGPLSKGAVCEADWGIRVRTTPNLNGCYLLALSPLPCFARLPPLKRGALKRKKTGFSPCLSSLCWRRPIFPVRLQTSIFGAGELNCRVRNGNGWTLTAKGTNSV